MKSLVLLFLAAAATGSAAPTAPVQEGPRSCGEPAHVSVAPVAEGAPYSLLAPGRSFL